MVTSLRTRLIISHTLPLLLLGSVSGIALIFIIETWVIIPLLARGLTSEGEIISAVLKDETTLWHSQAQAAAVVDYLQSATSSGIALYDSSGDLLAASEHYFDRNPQTRTDGSLMAALTIPVYQEARSVGEVHLRHYIPSTLEILSRVRLAIGGVLGAGVVLGIILGWVLSTSIAAPVTRLTRSLQDPDAQPMLIEESRGPREIMALIAAFNTFSKRLTLLEESRRHLLANLVHELGRPLGALLAALQALQSGAIDQRELREELLAGMNGEINRLRRLLDDLAGSYDEVLGIVELRLRSVDLNSYLPAVLSGWREAALQKNIGWQAELPGGLPSILIDPDRVAQVIGNLLSNAIKFTEAGGSITIRSYVSEPNFCLDIQDTGAGIPESERDHIFDSYHRAQQGHRFPQGMGLGLTIARDVAQAHGGSLSLQETSSAGSTFRFCLPLSLNDTETV